MESPNTVEKNQVVFIENNDEEGEGDAMEDEDENENDDDGRMLRWRKVMHHCKN